MALGTSNFLQNNSTSNSTTYTTAAFTMTANKWYIVVLECASATSPIVEPVPTDSAAELTFTLVGSGRYRGSPSYSRRVDVWKVQAPASPTANNTITFTASNTMTRGLWKIIGLSGNDTTDPIAQVLSSETDPGGTNNNGTSWTPTLSAFGSADNRPIVFVAHEMNEGYTYETANGWAAIGTDQTIGAPTGGLGTAWKSDGEDDTVSVSWTTAAAFGGVALELKALSTSPTVYKLSALGVG